MRRRGQDFLRSRRTWAGVVALAVVAGIAFGIRVTSGRPAAGTIRPGGTAASQPIVPACAHLRVS